jgi:HEPN domain-containing protein
MEPKEWLFESEGDIRKAKILFKGNAFDGSVFYAQQSAEKSLKAVIIFLKKRLIRTHDLLLLSRMVDLPENLLRKAVLLNPYYTTSRYPGVIKKRITLSETKVAINYAEEVFKWCKEKIETSK